MHEYLPTKLHGVTYLNTHKLHVTYPNTYLKLHGVTYLNTYQTTRRHTPEYPQTTRRHKPVYLPPNYTTSHTCIPTPKLLDVTYLNTYLPNYTVLHTWIPTSKTTRCHLNNHQTTRRHIPEYLPPKLHGVSPHNTVISMTAVRISNVAADLLFIYLTNNRACEWVDWVTLGLSLLPVTSHQRCHGYDTRKTAFSAAHVAVEKQLRIWNTVSSQIRDMAQQTVQINTIIWQHSDTRN
jgi:hypothetical protein